MKYIKKAAFLTFICLSFISLNFAQAGKTGVSDQAALVTEFDVNGLKVLVKRRTSAPTVAARLFIRGGARNISDKNAGIESFMLNVATEGSKKFPRDVLRRELAKTGSSIGSSASNDYSVLSLATTRQNFDKSWEIFTDIVLNPAFAAQDVALVRDKILTGLREQETDNDNFLQVLQDRVVYAKHPYANETSGTPETISKISAEDLRAYHQKTLQTSRLLLVIVGDLDAKELQVLLTQLFGKLPRGDYKEEPFPALDFSKATLDVTSRILPTNYIQGIFNAPALGTPDYSAMRVAMTILRDRIFEEVRNKRQLSYAPNAELNNFAANTANIYVTAVDANRAVSVMLNEIKNLKTEAVDDQVISGVSGLYLTTYYLGQETNAAQALELAKYELIGGGWRNAFTFLDKIREVTPKDIKTVANKYMKNIRFVAIGNPLAINKDIFLQN